MQEFIRDDGENILAVSALPFLLPLAFVYCIPQGCSGQVPESTY